MVANVIASFLVKKAVESSLSETTGGEKRIREAVDLSFPELDAGLALAGEISSSELDMVGQERGQAPVKLAGASDIAGPLPTGRQTKASSGRSKAKSKTGTTATGSDSSDADDNDIGKLLEVFLDKKFENVRSIVSSLAALRTADTQERTS